MRETFSKGFVVIVVGLAGLSVEGCKRHSAPPPVQPVVHTVPRAQPDFPVGSLPVEHVDVGAAPKVDRAPRRRQEVQPPPVQGPDAGAAAEAQRLEDTRLLQEQQAASQRQQQELNQEVEQNLKTQQQVQEEPRIQDVPPGPPLVQPTQPQ